MADTSKPTLAQKWHAQQQIGIINGKINKANKVKGDLNRCKGKLDKEIGKWKTEKAKLKGNNLNVKVTDTFEGEMADKLSAKVKEVNTEIKKGISDAENLSEAVSTQIQSLEQYCTRLEGQKAPYNSIINS